MLFRSQALRDQIAALQTGAVVSDKANALAAEAEQRLAEARDAAEALKTATEAATAATLRQAAVGRIGAALETAGGIAPWTQFPSKSRMLPRRKSKDRRPPKQSLPKIVKTFAKR